MDNETNELIRSGSAGEVFLRLFSKADSVSFQNKLDYFFVHEIEIIFQMTLFDWADVALTFCFYRRYGERVENLLNPAVYARIFRHQALAAEYFREFWDKLKEEPAVGKFKYLSIVPVGQKLRLEYIGPEEKVNEEGQICTQQFEESTNQEEWITEDEVDWGTSETMQEDEKPDLPEEYIFNRWFRPCKTCLKLEEVDQVYWGECFNCYHNVGK